jgi:hypothetical protein
MFVGCIYFWVRANHKAQFGNIEKGHHEIFVLYLTQELWLDRKWSRTGQRTLSGVWISQLLLLNKYMTG